ncbi:hypothetical protein Pla8534_23140 [Lignipirellula cremea]|uniref:Resolvase/invertase-type recombinase catalytic domain-containing protein n=2 Tax=Lignipirellula cremea TaxID=2528010 RepID=A0A518DRS8_9BACT|nr:hypothetical protein Pla8534_23140 [Lignipirellula cremea]
MNRKQPTPPTIRCAVYTRVSTNEQAEQEYSSIDAQRETGEAYVASQKHAGWQCVDERYDDGGFTGANTERPAFQRLWADIEAGKVDVIVTYKLDRLTRSLADFTANAHSAGPGLFGGRGALTGVFCTIDCLGEWRFSTFNWRS